MYISGMADTRIKCLKCKELKTEDSFDLYKICMSCLNQKSYAQKKRERANEYYQEKRGGIQQRNCIFRERNRDRLNALANGKSNVIIPIAIYVELVCQHIGKQKPVVRQLTNSYIVVNRFYI